MDTDRSIPLTFAVLSSGHFLVDFYVNILPPVMPQISSQLGLSMGLNGLLFTLLSITTSWVQPFAGFACDRLSSRWFLPLSLVWLAFLMCSIGWLGNYWLLVALTCLAGIGSAVYHPLGSVTISSLDSRNRGLMLSVYITIGTLGMTAAPVVAVAVTRATSLKGLALLSLFSLPAALLLLKYARYDNAKSPDIQPQPEQSRLKLSDLRPVLLLMIMMGFRMWVLKTFGVFIPHYYYAGTGHSESLAAAILSAYLFAESIGSVIGGYAADRVGIRRVIFYSGVIALVLNVGFSLTTGTAAVILLCLSAAAFHSGFPVSVLMAQEMLPAQKNMASGLMLGFTFGLGSFGSLVTGMVSDYLGGNLLAALGTTNIVAAISIILALPLLKKQRPGAQKISA